MQVAQGCGVVDTALRAINEVGFPIVVALVVLYLLVRNEKRQEMMLKLVKDVLQHDKDEEEDKED